MRHSCLEKDIIKGTYIGNEKERTTKNNAAAQHHRLDENES